MGFGRYSLLITDLIQDPEAALITAKGKNTWRVCILKPNELAMLNILRRLVKRILIFDKIFSVKSFTKNLVDRTLI